VDSNAPSRRLLVATALVSATVAVVGDDLRAVVLQAFGWTTTVVVIVTTRRFEPSDRLPWRLLSVAGVASLAAGIAKVTIVQPLPDGSIPVPSLAELLFAVVYLSILGCEVVLIRRRHDRGERGHLLDAVLPAAAVGFALWAFVLEPYVNDPTQPLAERLTNVAFAAVSLLILTATLRLAVGGGARPPAYHLLAGAMGLFLASDLAVTLGLAHDADTTVNQYLTAPVFGLLAAAATHPSARQIVDRPLVHRTRLTRARVVLLAGALLMSPSMLLVYELAGRRDRLVNVLVGSAVTSVLVLARVVGLIRAEERSNARELVLRRAGERLLVASDLGEISAILRDGAAGVLGAGAGAHVQRGDAPRADANDDPDGTERRFALGDDDGQPCWLVVRTERPLDVATADALEALARDGGLALRALAAVRSEIRQRSDHRFRALIEHTDDIVVVASSDGTVDYVSPAVERLVARRAEELVGGELRSLFVGDALGEYLHRAGRSERTLPTMVLEAETPADADTGPRVVELTVADLRHEPGIDGIVLNGRDVTDRRRLERSLRHQARHDHLTGLPNRAMLMERLGEALGTLAGTPVALLFLDLDDFKDVNDSLGHEAGDQLLVAAAERLGAAVRHGDLAARIGGDEFAVLLPDVVGETDALEVAHRVIESLSRPLVVAGREMSCAVSVGVALDYDRSSTPEVLLRNADVAMYRAKDRGKGRVECFEEHLHTSAFHRFEVRTELQRALEADELRLHYQPIVDLGTGEIVGAEALVRWQHPHKGLLGPVEFIPVAEATGLIVGLGRWVLGEATRQAGAWRRQLGIALRTSVNVSVRQLDDPGVVDEVARAVRDAGIDPEQLCVEITESVFASDQAQARACLHALRAQGVRIAIDDFGTGYSSLTQIQDYPFDVLKIDKSFVDRLGGDRRQDGVVRTILRLARELGVTTVAEGIEEVVQHDELVALGCTHGQGYLYSRPVTAAEFEELLERGSLISDRTPATATASSAATNRGGTA